jgi:hypothetical protein
MINLKRDLWLILIVLGLVLFFFGVQLTRAQTIAGSGLTIGSPPTPPGGLSKVRIAGLGEVPGPVFSEADGDLFMRLLVKGDLPPGIAWLADDQTFTGINTLTGATNVVGQSTFSLGIIAPSIRTTTGLPFLIRDPANTVSILSATASQFNVSSQSAAFAMNVTIGDIPTKTGDLVVWGDARFQGYLTLPEYVTAGGTVTTGGDLVMTANGRRIKGNFFSETLAERIAFQSNVPLGQAANTVVQAWPAGAAKLAAFAVYNSSNPVANQPFASISINETQTAITSGAAGNLSMLPMAFMYGDTKTAQMDFQGWKFYSKVGTAGLYSLTDPFTIYATDSVTPLMQLYDPGRNVIRNTGRDTFWEYQAHGNAEGEKLWRAGIAGGQYRIDAGNDAGTTWSNLFRSSMAGGIPNGLFWGTGVKQVTPDLSFETVLGELTKKYLALHVGELWADTLVANETLATIGGRILVGPTTTIEQEFTTANNEWYVPFKHQVATGDILVLQGQKADGSPQVEFIKALGYHGTCAQVGWCDPSVSPNAFYWTVQRNLDGSDPVDNLNFWAAGSAAFNTRQGSGPGFIDLYSMSGLKSTGETGPTIVGNVRVDNTYNNWAPRWAIGNLAGLYQQGAANTYGVAFGDSKAVWMIMDSTYGFRGMLGDPGAQKFVIHPSGYIMLGDSAAGVMNTLIEPGTVWIRSGVVPRTALNATGVYNYDSTGALRTYLDMEGLYIYNQSGTQVIANIGHNSSRFGYALAYHNSIYLEQSTGRMIFYSARTDGVQIPRIVIDAANAAIRFYDTGGGYEYMNLGVSGSTFGYSHAAFGNVHITNAGQLYLRAGGTPRMLLDANGAMTFYDPSSVARQQITSTIAQFGGVDTGARITMAAGVLSMYDNSNRLWYQINPGVVYMGDWYNVGGTYLQLSPAQQAFCNAGYSCPLVFYGTSGNITAGGNILLSGGGNVTSSGNFTLGATSGLRFEVYSAAAYEANRAIQWFKAGVMYADMGMDNAGSMLIHSRTWGGGTGIRLAVGTADHLVGGLRPGVFLTHEPASGYHLTNFVLQGISANGNATMTQIIPLHGANSPAVNNAIGGVWSGTAWHNMYGGTYWTNGVAGYSGVVYLKNSAGVNYCQMNFSGGLMTGHNC